MSDGIPNGHTGRGLIHVSEIREAVGRIEYQQALNELLAIFKSGNAFRSDTRAGLHRRIGIGETDAGNIVAVISEAIEQDIEHDFDRLVYFNAYTVIGISSRPLQLCRDKLFIVDFCPVYLLWAA